VPARPDRKPGRKSLIFPSETKTSHASGAFVF